MMIKLALTMIALFIIAAVIGEWIESGWPTTYFGWLCCAAIHIMTLFYIGFVIKVWRGDI